MNLRDLRIEFVTKSGRYDLVEPDDGFRDNGANFFIQAGQRLLDKRGDFGTGQIREYLLSTSSGRSEYLIPNCWSILNLLISKDGKGDCFESVERVHSPECDKCRFGNSFYYTIVPLEQLPKIKDAKANTINLPANAVAQELETVQGLRINFYPKPDRVYLLKVIGHFFSPTLVSDQDENYWSVSHPETLLKAAMYELEVFYRNTEGAKDWMEAILTDLQQIEQMQLFGAVQGELIMGD